MRQINTNINISASPETVWKVLMDFDNYPQWNPFMISIEGEKVIGKKLTVKIKPPNGKEMTFKPEILIFESNKKLKWLGKAGLKGIFDGEHSFHLENQNDGSTKFIHGEKFSGILVGLMGKTLAKTELGFKQMNEALKKECESKK